MKAFRGSGAHAAVMPKLVEWCDETAYTRWVPANEAIPGWWVRMLTHYPSPIGPRPMSGL
jgi:hypothetical protein